MNIFLPKIVPSAKAVAIAENISFGLHIELNSHDVQRA